MEKEDKLIMDKYAIGEIKASDSIEEYITDIYNNKLSICCEERLTHYDKKWDDGLCSKCKEHSGAKGGRNDE